MPTNNNPDFPVVFERHITVPVPFTIWAEDRGDEHVHIFAEDDLGALHVSGDNGRGEQSVRAAMEYLIITSNLHNSHGGFLVNRIMDECFRLDVTATEVVAAQEEYRKAHAQTITPQQYDKLLRVMGALQHDVLTLQSRLDCLDDAQDSPAIDADELKPAKPKRRKAVPCDNSR